MKNLRKLVLLVLLLSFNLIVWSQHTTSDYSYTDRCTLQKKDEPDKIPSPAPARKLDKVLNNGTKSRASMSFSDWNSYNGSSLVQKLKQTTDYQNQLKSLFDFNESYGSNIFSNSNVEAVAREMYNISIAHDGTYNSGMYGLVCYLHTATYHNFFQESITLNENSLYWYRLACESFTQNSHLFEISTEAISILDEFLIMVDQPDVRHRPRIIELLKDVMRNVVTNKNWKGITDDRLMRSYATMANRIYFLMFRGVQPADDRYVEALKDDSEFYNLIYKIATDEEIKNNDELNFLQDNSVGEMARAASIKDFVPLVDHHLAEFSKAYPRLHVNWLKSVEAINKYCDCSKFNLCENLEALRAEINQKLFPHTWKFDNGKMLIKTSLSYEHVEPLYYAAKQVEAQMYRVLQTDQAVLNDPNETLNMVVYGTLEEYKAYQTFLNNLSTDNGGMYIERDATFYTYERTPAQSTYSLEELFRHEYTHYLQGRYIENGFWGSTDFFKNDRLTWFEEGMAEFMAGSTSSDGIKYRKSMMRNVASDGDDRLPVNKTIGAGYSSGFKFYRYAYIIWLYLYHNDMATMRELMNYIKADNITAFDARVNSLKNSSSFQQKIDAFIDESLTKSDQWWTPTTPYLPDDDLNVGQLTDIEKEFKSISGINEIEVVSDAEQSIGRFGIKGKLQGGQFNQKLDQLIKTLNDDEYINNFDYLVGYYKNVSGTTADFYITGSLKDKTISDTPECSFVVESSTGLVGQAIKLRSTSRGYIKGFKWETSNGVFTDSATAETEVKFMAPGKYDISLTISGNDGKSYTHTIENALDIYAPSSLDYCEVNTNNDYAHIEQVSLGAIDNNNDIFHDNGYADYTHIASKISKGKNINLSVDVSYSVEDTHINAWVDWNQDGSFDTSEQIMHSNGLNPLTSDFMIPEDAPEGLTRLRIRYALRKDLDACEYNSYVGETHDYSLIVEGTAPEDTEAPTAPAELSTTAIDAKSISLAWHASTDNVGVKGYTIFVNGEINANTTHTNYRLENLLPETSYTIYVQAYDANNNRSGNSNSLAATTLEDLDTTAPSIPENLVLVEKASTWMEIKWDTSTDNVKVEGYTIFVNGEKMADSTSPNCKLENLLPETSYVIYIKAYDAKNNTSDISISLTAVTDKEPDTTAPTQPENLVLIDKSSSWLEIKWDASTDNVAVKAYQIWLNQNLFDTSSTNTFLLDGLTSGTEYTIHIVALDESSNESSPSTPLVVSTDAETSSYCDLKSNSQTYEWIKGVFMANLSNRSEKSAYSDFTDIVSTVRAGEQTWITIEPGFRPNEPYTEYLVVWIDWNKNNSFEDEEIILNQSGNRAMGSWFTVPETFYGSTRMRIALQYGSKPNSCGEIQGGEVEDYTIGTSGTKRVKTEMAESFIPDVKQTFTAYPNPTHGKITLEIPEQFNNASIRLINNLGVTVLNTQAITSREVLNLNGLSSGNYFIIISNDTGVIKKQIIIN